MDTGQPNLVRQVVLSGDFGALARKLILKDLDCEPGQTIWTANVQAKAVQSLNNRFAKSNYLFAKADFYWDPVKGELNVDIKAGPMVSLRVSGAKLNIGRLKEYLNLPVVDRFGTDLLAETDRRLTAKFQDDGCPLVFVRHTLTPINGKSPEEAIQLEYIVSNADVMYIADIKIKGNIELEESDLLKAAKINFGNFLFKKPKAIPEIIDNSLNHVLSYCLSLGYVDARVKYDWLAENKQFNLLITVNEGKRYELREIDFVFNMRRQQDTENIINRLFDFFNLNRLQKDNNLQFEFKPNNEDWINGPMRWETIDKNSYKLIMLDPTPFIRINIAAIRLVIQQALASNGVINPTVTVDIESGKDNGVKVRLYAPQQNIEHLHRLVIQGAEHTKADFILTEIRPMPNQPGVKLGDPLVISSITGARTNLSSLGIFSSVDARTMEEAAGGSSAGPTPWQPGDMLFRLKERQLWNFSNAFSYDRSLGYQFGIGAQRINIGGQAKTIDFSVRAGDGTIDNPTLRRIFSTGNPGRSLDVYSIGFSDPWLSTRPFSNWLSDRGLLRNELAYIKERQGAYLVFRRRSVTSVEWRMYDVKNNIRTVRFGYRFENVGVSGPDVDEMQTVVGSPQHSILSVPFIQFVRDTRDHPFDPKKGSITSLQLDIALQALATSANSSFIKAEFNHSWNFSVGEDSRFGVTSLTFRLGAACPTASTSLEIPLSERFFAGGPNSHRGIEPDQLGPFGVLYLRELVPPYDYILSDDGRKRYRAVPIGGQALVLVNLDYRFPLPIWGQWIWGVLFIDSGEVYNRIRNYDIPGSLLPPFPNWRTSIGTGLVLRLGGFPIKLEYAWDVRKMMGKKDGDVYSRYADRTRLRNLLISAGFQF
jgi:outer membrane protein assembly factor BamA